MVGPRLNKRPSTSGLKRPTVGCKRPGGDEPIFRGSEKDII